MGNINKQSVREEDERIKNEFARLAENKKIDGEINMLLQSMLMLINLLIAIFLEKTTLKNNKNSSKPSSQTDKDESALSNQGTNGKGKQESSAVANNTRTQETVTISKAMACNDPKLITLRASIDGKNYNLTANQWFSQVGLQVTYGTYHVYYCKKGIVEPIAGYRRVLKHEVAADYIEHKRENVAEAIILIQELDKYFLMRSQEGLGRLGIETNDVRRRHQYIYDVK